MKNFFIHADIESQDLGGGAVRKVLAHSENLMLVEINFDKGAIGALHKHPHEQCSYVKAGAFEFEIDGVKKIVREGDTTYIHPEALHGVVCLEKGVLVDVFTPERKDFL